MIMSAPSNKRASPGQVGAKEALHHCDGTVLRSLLDDDVFVSDNEIALASEGIVVV